MILIIRDDLLSAIPNIYLKNIFIVDYVVCCVTRTFRGGPTLNGWGSHPL
ncbi:hypothetical protein Hanom_Chr12g01081111 [Helianthus anomalus]